MACRKRERSAVSSQGCHALHAEQFFDDKDEQYDWEVCKRVRSAQSTSEATQLATKEELPDFSVHTNILIERSMKSGKYVKRMAMEPAMSEKAEDLLR